MKVYIPPPLRSYTGSKEVDVEGNTLRDVLSGLDRRYPGIRFRVVNEQDGIREHIRFFVNQELAKDLNTQLRPGDEIHIICAISGG
ncbi:MAG: MoaD/ThiS family protein [Dehalococcoidia bacterium]